MDTFSTAFIRRFHELYDRGPGCWLWFGGTDQDGYGKIRYGRKTYKAHRIAYMLAQGEIPPGHVIMHSCDVRRCVNPKHLSLGTVKLNNQDMTRKGRLRIPPRACHVTGARNNLSKLSARQVLSIRARAAAGCRVRLLAQECGVSERTIAKIIKRETWTHI